MPCSILIAPSVKKKKTATPKDSGFPHDVYLNPKVCRAYCEHLQISAKKVADACLRRMKFRRRVDISDSRSYKGTILLLVRNRHIVTVTLFCVNVGGERDTVNNRFGYGERPFTFPDTHVLEVFADFEVPGVFRFR